jgi:hypothetical protein
MLNLYERHMVGLLSNLKTAENLIINSIRDPADFCPKYRRLRE